MDLKEVGYDDREWINLAQDRDRWRAYVRAAMNLGGSLKASKLCVCFPKKRSEVRFVKWAMEEMDLPSTGLGACALSCDWSFDVFAGPTILLNIKSRRLRWAGHVARMGESRNAYEVLVGRPEGKRPLGRPRHKWEDNIKIDLREVGYDDREWINFAQDRDQWQAYVRATMNLRVP
ncbi:hypothetical protein ANN_05756 [Periplaneta americana]|uniref:Uncharacterized protein n=1 Tax=Periplaneta americana TaxID=6978 RepID=A0ABQ8TBP1_PERAM|nr:hypothetical protein ANN_05756 [Periplaneta americana]